MIRQAVSYLRSWIATIDVMLDREAVRALREAEAEPDELTRDYEDVRRELGVTAHTTQKDGAA